MDKICRICFSKEDLHYIFGYSRLYLKIMKISNVRITASDQLSPFICKLCEENVIKFLEFKNKIEKSNVHLLSLKLLKKEKKSKIDVDSTRPFEFLSCTKTDVIETKTPITDSTNIVTKIKKKENENGNSIVAKIYPVDIKAKILNSVKKKKIRSKAECNICGKFIEAHYLKEHLRIHSNDRPFICKICSKGFKQPSILKKHMLLHTGESLYLCHICSKGFKQSTHFRTHMIGHSGERNFSCNQCHKTFRTKYDLKKHNIVHTDERPYVCTDCTARFKKKHNLKKHQSNHLRNKISKCN